MAESLRSTGAASRPHIVAIPYPARGHINPMMSICRLLSAHGVLVSLIVTEEWLSLLSSSSSPAPESINFLSIPNVLPSEKIRGSDMPAFVHAVLTQMEAPIEELIGRIRLRPRAFLADSLLPWVPEIGRRRGIPVSALFAQSAAELLALHAFAAPSATGEANKWLGYLPKGFSQQFASFSSYFPGADTILAFFHALSWSTTSAQCLLLTTFYELESDAIDVLRSTFSVPVLTIGPAISHMLLDEKPSNAEDIEKQYRWLDSQPQGSVLYISLGSYIPVSVSRMKEISAGLRMSGVRFFWTTRELSQGDDAAGLIVAWCDQLKVLCHPSVGGFFTHCGWNSVLEAVYAGVPLLTFPLMWDQYPNSKIVVDDWKIGLSLRSGEEGEGGIIAREKISEIVRRLMVGSGEEEEVGISEIRKKVREMKNVCHKAVGRNGSSSACLDAFLLQIRRNMKEEDEAVGC